MIGYPYGARVRSKAAQDSGLYVARGGGKGGKLTGTLGEGVEGNRCATRSIMIWIVRCGSF